MEVILDELMYNTSYLSPFLSVSAAHFHVMALCLSFMDISINIKLICPSLVMDFSFSWLNSLPLRKPFGFTGNGHV
jgi:hypothetical protein